MSELTIDSPTLHTGAHARWLRRLASACVLLMLVVVTSSAWLRLAQERPTCGNWPVCRAAPAVRSPPAPASVGRADVLERVRFAHRAAASALLPAACALAWLALGRRPRQTAVGARALGMLALALALAALGIVTPSSRSPAVLLGNQLGGLLLLALAWSTWRTAAATPAVAANVRWARAVALLWLLQAALGALSGAGFGIGPPLTHLVLAAPAVLAAFALGLSGWYRERRAEALTLALLAVLQVLLGLAAMLSAAPPALVLGHAAVAAVGLALLFDYGRPSAGPRRGTQALSGTTR